MAPELLVLGLGNPLRRDDGVGPRVVELLLQGGLPPEVEAIDAGTSGYDLLNLLGNSESSGGGVRQVVIVDAADLGLEAGQFARFTPEQVELAQGAPGSGAHQAGLAEAFALARALERRLPKIVIFGVQPDSLEWGTGLSSKVEAALPPLVAAVLEEVHKQPGSESLRG